MFNCSVNGNPPPSIEWTKDNITVDPKLSTSSSGNTHSLTITDVHRSDEGQYRCVANNAVDTTTSLAGTLEVHCEYAFNFRVGLTSCNIPRIVEGSRKLKIQKLHLHQRKPRDDGLVLLKAQYNSALNNRLLLFSPDGQDRNSLQLEKVGSKTFSNSTVVHWKSY